jgi:hypothetical protein
LGKISFTVDMWSDPNLTPFMAVTAHWIESKVQQTTQGPQHILKLQSDLIGFIRVPGRHDGEHLAQAFVCVVKRMGVLHKVSLMLLMYICTDYSGQIGFITLDNASNNDTMMFPIEKELRRRGISFNSVECRIQYSGFFG